MSAGASGNGTYAQEAWAASYKCTEIGERRQVARDVEAAIQRAVERERERCAKIAESVSFATPREDEENRVAIHTAIGIAAALRATPNTGG